MELLLHRPLLLPQEEEKKDDHFTLRAKFGLGASINYVYKQEEGGSIKYQ